MALPTSTARLTGTAAPVEVVPGMTLLTVEEAARRLSLGRTTVYALLKCGQITSVRIGRLRRIPVQSLTEYTTRLAAEQHGARRDLAHVTQP
jgi:excisionase family DNA binding protein